MNCPACKSSRLQPDELEPGLKARLCPHCRGYWIPFAEYLPWVEAGARTGARAEEAPEADALFGRGPTAPLEGEHGGSPTAGSAAGGAAGTAGVGGVGAGAGAGGAAKVKLCPECGRFLRRYQLGMGVDFEVERCGGCAGVWCDRGKWPRLREAGAHARLHLLFSDSWQLKLKEEQLRKRQEDRVRSILGDDDFERARVFKAWVDGHPQRGTLRAFLAEDFAEKPPPSSR